MVFRPPGVVDISPIDAPLCLEQSSLGVLDDGVDFIFSSHGRSWKQRQQSYLQ